MNHEQELELMIQKRREDRKYNLLLEELEILRLQLTMVYVLLAISVTGWVIMTMGCLGGN
jgi:hypothetical protein